MVVGSGLGSGTGKARGGILGDKKGQGQGRGQERHAELADGRDAHAYLVGLTVLGRPCRDVDRLASWRGRQRDKKGLGQGQERQKELASGRAGRSKLPEDDHCARTRMSSYLSQPGPIPGPGPSRISQSPTVITPKPPASPH